MLVTQKLFIRFSCLTFQEDILYLGNRIISFLKRLDKRRYFYTRIYIILSREGDIMYAIYLRKSRADQEAEARGEGETLARHEQELTKLSIKMKLPIGAVYKEIVSGETISARPWMQQLLLEVMQGKWEGVLVMEVERLARGDTKDQGTVAEAFKFSHTKIITPSKTYDPDNEFDEEYFEFNLFMSRREYKTINRRIQRGRVSAFDEGWYIAGTAPYGYEKVKKKENKGYVLEIVPDEAKIVQLIYELYTASQEDGASLGSYQICERLNLMQVPSRTGRKWSASSVIDILRNPVYAGYQRWGWRKPEKQLIDGRIIESRPKNDDCKKVRGKFKPIISEELYEQAQLIRKCKPIPKTGITMLQNPLSGLIYCAKCGTMMARSGSNTKTNYPVLRCPNSRCNNISAPLLLVEQKLLTSLSDWLRKYELDWPEKEKDEYASIISFKEAAYKSVQSAYGQTEKQLSNTYDLLEQGIYDIETFQERRRVLEEKRCTLRVELDKLKRDYDNAIESDSAQRDYIPKVKNIISVYWTIDDVSVRNEMLKSVLIKADYLKTERNRKGQGSTANFTLNIYPKTPKEP